MNTSRISKPALVIAVAAATVGVVGTTTAVAGQRGPNTAPAHAAVTGPGAAVATGDRFAVVNADGSLAKGKGVFSASNLGFGQYEVLFNRNISRCVLVATIGSSASAGVESPGEITTVRRASTTNGVFVSTHDSSGSFSNRGFHLLVGCP